MLKNCITFTVTAVFSINVLYSKECLPDLDNALPKINVPKINLEVNTNSNFCFDALSESNPELLRKFDVLKKKYVFDDSFCLKDKKFDSETNAEITDLIIQTTRGQLNVYATQANAPSETTKLIMTNSKDLKFVNKAMLSSQEKKDDQKLTTKDTLQIAGAAAIGSLVGRVVEGKAFKNPDGSPQHDKLLHANYGALINFGSVGTAYLAVETAGLGDTLELTETQKKWVILLTGTVTGLLVGYGKERFYDYYHSDRHKYDPHLNGDVGATWLGGGALNVLGGGITFQF